MLRTLREKTGLSLRQVAAGVGISHTALAYFENGARKINGPILSKLTCYLAARMKVSGSYNLNKTQS